MGAAARALDREEHPYRMKDLCERTGLPRQVVHFYIQQGLVPEGRKTGRNMAYYGERHVERIRLVRKLQHERFLPLRAIRAMLDGEDEMFSDAQRELLSSVKVLLAGTGATRPDRPEMTDAREAIARVGIREADLRQMIDAGLIATETDAAGRLLVARDDAWMFEVLAELRAAGFTPELGFDARELGMYEDAIAALFRKEAAILTRRLAHLPPARVAAMVEKTLPIVGAMLAKFHTDEARRFFAAIS